MDYCHNVPGLERLAEALGRFKAARTIGVITVPGDRATADIDAFDRLAVIVFDTIAILTGGEDDSRSRRSISVGKQNRWPQSGGAALELSITSGTGGISVSPMAIMASRCSTAVARSSSGTASDISAIARGPSSR